MPKLTKQPYELVLSFSGQQPAGEREQKIRRSRRGCFNCRKRKKKCDELRPICSSCQHKCIQCVWPAGKEKVPQDYQIPAVDKTLLEERRKQKPLELIAYTAPEKPRPTSPLRFDISGAISTGSTSSSSPSERSVKEESLVPEKVRVTDGSHGQQERHQHHHEYSANTSTTNNGLLVFNTQSTQLVVPLDKTTTSQDMLLESQYDQASYPTTDSPSQVSLDGSISLNEGRQPTYTDPLQWFQNNIYSDQMFMPDQGDRFMSAAINGFVVSLGPQHTHPLLTANATFTPLIQANGILGRIAEAIGSAFLSWTNPDLTELSSQKYAGSLDFLFDSVARTGIRQEDELWIAAAFQLLVLGAKVTWGCDNLISVKSLKMSYEVIKMKMARRGRRVTSPIMHDFKTMPRVTEPNRMTDRYVNDMIGNDGLMMEVENTMAELTDDSGLTPFERQFERMFIESFVYNFSICILVTPPSQMLPNPFEVFRDLRRYLKTPLFACDVAWMNNPVLGASFDSYEIAAKASYLIRHIGEFWVHECASKMLEMADYYPPPMLPQEVRQDSVLYQSLRDSILISEIVMKAAKIVLLKVIDPQVHATDPLIQQEVRSTMFKLKQIAPTAQVRVISAWALFVIGLACVDEENRAEVINSSLILGELMHGRFVYTVIDALEVSWGRGSKLGLDSPSRGLDVLLDMELLSKVFI